MKKNSASAKLVFSANEIAYCEGKTHKYEEHYAARPRKSILKKRWGTGWAEGKIAFNEVEVINDKQGTDSKEPAKPKNSSCGIADWQCKLLLTHIKFGIPRAHHAKTGPRYRARPLIVYRRRALPVTEDFGLRPGCRKRFVCLNYLFAATNEYIPRPNFLHLCESILINKYPSGTFLLSPPNFTPFF